MRINYRGGKKQQRWINVQRSALSTQMDCSRLLITLRFDASINLSARRAPSAPSLQ
jgi:hypothetical protein